MIKDKRCVVIVLQCSSSGGVVVVVDGILTDLHSAINVRVA